MSRLNNYVPDSTINKILEEENARNRERIKELEELLAQKNATIFAFKEWEKKAMEILSTATLNEAIDFLNKSPMRCDEQFVALLDKLSEIKTNNAKHNNIIKNYVEKIRRTLSNHKEVDSQILSDLLLLKSKLKKNN